MCPDHNDTVLVFRGSVYWTVSAEGSVRGPLPLRHRWADLPPAIEAAAFSLLDSKWYFFKGTTSLDSSTYKGYCKLSTFSFDFEFSLCKSSLSLVLQGSGCGASLAAFWTQGFPERPQIWVYLATLTVLSTMPHWVTWSCLKAPATLFLISIPCIKSPTTPVD